jgi:hypothetical protein
LFLVHVGFCGALMNPQTVDLNQERPRFYPERFGNYAPHCPIPKHAVPAMDITTGLHASRSLEITD